MASVRSATFFSKSIFATWDKLNSRLTFSTH
jgi:hypothetical protein